MGTRNDYISVTSIGIDAKAARYRWRWSAGGDAAHRGGETYDSAEDANHPKGPYSNYDCDWVREGWTNFEAVGAMA